MSSSSSSTLARVQSVLSILNHQNEGNMLKPIPNHVDILILGAGWTAGFLIPLLNREDVSHAATTTSGRDGTLSFKFDPDSTDTGPYKQLPSAKTVLISFPLKGHGQSNRLTQLYNETHAKASPHFLQLGATTVWNAKGWSDRNTPIDKSNARGQAEDELLAGSNPNSVLDLAGLYGGERNPRAFLTRVVTSKDVLKTKDALHMVHGADVARAILAVHRNWDKCGGQRWLLTDGHTYDWWDLVSDWCAPAEADANTMAADQRARERELMGWVWACMRETGVKAIPRGPESLGRVLDSRDFWLTMGILPSVGRLK